MSHSRLACALLLLSACSDARETANPPIDAGDQGLPRASLCINEFMAENAFTLVEAGARPDWIELYNPGPLDIDLFGFLITDDLAFPAKHRFTESIVVPAGDTRLLYADRTPSRGPEHLGFELDKHGEAIALVDPQGRTVEALVYGPQATDLSAVGILDGWDIERNPSPGVTNHPNCRPPSAPSLSAPQHVDGLPDPSESLYDMSYIPEFSIELSPSSLAALSTEPKTYVEGTFLFEGRRYGPVGVRLKGNDTLRPIGGKPSFKIKFSEYVVGAEFMELKRLTLNNMITDPTMMSERLAYQVFRELGVPAPRCNHARVYLNGEFYGLYANVETVRSPMVQRWFDDASGALFEGEGADFSLEDLDGFVLDDGPDDRTHLEGLAFALTLPPAAAMAQAESDLDVDQFILYWAVSMAIGHVDGYPYKSDDYHVYSDPTTGVMHFIPWGTDEAWSSANITHVDELLATTCNLVAACKANWRSRLSAVLDAVDAMGLIDRVVAAKAQIAEHVAQDTRKEFSNAVVDAEQEHLKNFIARRRERIQDDINAAP